MMRLIPRRVGLAAAMLLATAAPGWAETTVKVSLVGESGGAMGMKLDTDTVKAGPVSFVVTNDAARTGHEMIVIKLKSKDEVLPLSPGKHRIDEKALTSLGEVSNLKPGKQGVLKATLGPGDYRLICNVRGHYEAGMEAALTVSP